MTSQMSITRSCHMLDYN